VAEGDGLQHLRSSGANRGVPEVSKVFPRSESINDAAFCTLVAAARD
jgi:hypothetical protein